MCLFVPALRRFVHNERIHDALCALFSLVQELFFFFILGLKGTERLHRRSTDERERESKGVKKEELLSLLKNSIALFFFSSLLASFHACGDVCAFLVSSSKVRRSLRCSVNTGKQEKKKATTNTQAARKWTQAGRLRLKDRVRGARSVT